MLKAQQVESRRVQDQALRAQIEELREKVRAYKPKISTLAAPPDAEAKNMVKLGKKNKDGSISRVEAPAHSQVIATAAAQQPAADNAVNAAE